MCLEDEIVDDGEEGLVDYALRLYELQTYQRIVLVALMSVYWAIYQFLQVQPSC